MVFDAPAGAPASGAPANGAHGSATAPDAVQVIVATRKANLIIKQLEGDKRRRIEAQARGELVPASDIQAKWIRQVHVVRAAFLAFPGRVAARVVGRDFESVHATLEEELREVLEGFAVEQLA